MINAVITNTKNSKSAFIETTYEGEQTIITASNHNINGKFKTALRTSAGTTIIATPKLGRSIILTDIIISASKAAGSTATVRFYDGTNSQNIIQLLLADAPIALSIPLIGKWKGWLNAQIELVTVGSTNCSVSVGFCDVIQEQTITYDEFLAQ